MTQSVRCFLDRLLMEKVVMCMEEGEGTSLWTSGKLNWLFSEPPTVYHVNTHASFLSLLFNAIKSK